MEEEKDEEKTRTKGRKRREHETDFEYCDYKNSANSSSNPDISSTLAEENVFLSKLAGILCDRVRSKKQELNG